MEQRIIRSQVADESQAGMRFDQAAAELFPEYSRSRLQQWIRHGELTLDGAKCKPTSRIRGGERLDLDAEPEVEVDAKPEDIPLGVLFEDEEIIVLNKAEGMVVHPAPGNRDGTLQNALLHHEPGLAHIPRSGLVHRLDKDTSGVMVVARTLQAHARLVDQLQRRQMKRIYQAVAIGELLSSGVVDAPIGRHPKDRKRMAVVARGKPAVTHYAIHTRFNGFTHLDVSLETGRTHQIRVHLAHQGFPLLGDPVYGRRWPKSSRKSPMSSELEAHIRRFRRQALHAWRLELIHPTSKKVCRFEAPLAEDFAELLDGLAQLTPREAG